MTIIEKARLMRSKLDMACTYLTDEQAEEVTVLYPMWEVGIAYSVGDRRQYEGLLYKCVQAHTSQADWTPDVVPALWVRTSTEEWPEWKQPQGAHDAYNKGDKCSYKGKHYICTADGNIYPPDVFGWEEVV
jgi:chitodextrinase